MLRSHLPPGPALRAHPVRMLLMAWSCFIVVQAGMWSAEPQGPADVELLIDSKPFPMAGGSVHIPAFHRW